MINTTFREQKHRSLPTPIYRSRKPMPLEITTFRVAFVHIDNNSSYDLRKPIYSLLKVYPRTCVSSPRSLSLRKPLLVDNYKSLSPKVSNQTDNRLVIYAVMYIICNNNFFLVFIVVIWLY